MSPRLKRTMMGAVAVVAIAVGGAAIGNAATSQSAATTTTTIANSSPSVGSQVPAFPAHGTSAHEDAEKAVSGDAATKAKAAAVKAVGSGTAGAVTTDFTGNGYEVTVTKSDGSTTEIHLDSSFNVQQGPGGFGH